MKLYYDFSGLLLIATIFIIVCWAADALIFRKKRKEGVPPSFFIEILKSVFPIVLIVFLVRAVIFEPFRIPTGSMKPTLLEGDFILVNKFIYGLRVPLIGHKVLNVSEPKRGDVMVFRFPKDTSIDFIKRVIGVPGDKIRYENKILYINDEPMTQEFVENTRDVDLTGRSYDVKELSENLGDKIHKVWINKEQGNDKKEIIVPEGHYFMMGDNRDASDDSRFWGFVPQELILGKASYIWMSWDMLNKDVRWKRIGRSL